jgi:hypothetical protein
MPPNHIGTVSATVALIDDLVSAQPDSRTVRMIMPAPRKIICSSPLREIGILLGAFFAVTVAFI